MPISLPEMMECFKQALDEAPKADSMHWWKCEACEHLHVILLDENDKPLAAAVMSLAMLERMLMVISEARDGGGASIEPIQ